MILCEQSKMILQFIDEVGGITKEQIDVLFPGADTRAKEYYINAIKGTYIKETSKGSGVYVSSSGKSPFLKKNEIAGWVLLKNEVNMDPDCKEYFKAAHPAQIFFMSEGKVYTVCYVDENGDGVIKAMNERYFAANEKADDNSAIIFATTSESVIDMVKNSGINAPCIGALVSQNSTGAVDIEYSFFE